MKRELGQSKVSVLPIGLGAMPLSLVDRPKEPDALEVILAAVDAGVDFIDTANVYCIDDSDIGHNERLIAKALKQRRDANVKVATKGGLERPSGSWVTNGHPKALRLACEQSLKALEVKEIFLYQLHAPDPSVTFEDSVGELSRLQEQGKIIHIGISNVDKAQIDRAQRIVRVETVQNRFNPLCRRDLTNGVLEACHHHHMSYIAYSPVGGHHGHQSLSEQELLVELAAKYKITSFQLMLAWCISKDDSIIAIPGASKKKSIIDSVASLGIQLDAGDIARIDEVTMTA